MRAAHGRRKAGPFFPSRGMLTSPGRRSAIRFVSGAARLNKSILGGLMRNLLVWAHAGSAVAAALAVTGLCGSAYGQAPDISGTYWATEYHPKIQLVGGGELPLTAAGKAAYEKNVAGLKDGSITDNARKFCVPDGLPRALATPYPFEIIQAPPGQITMVHDLIHLFRVVAMDQPRPSDKEHIPFPYYNGHSVGRF